MPLTSRWVHTTPPTGIGPGSGAFTTWDAAAAFGATRLDWIYSTDAAFVAGAKERGLQNVGLAMNGELPDPPRSPGRTLAVPIRKRLNDVTIRVPVRQGRQGDSMGGREWER